MEILNEQTTNLFYDLLTEEMGVIRNVQNDAEIISLKIKNQINNTKSLPINMDLTTFKNGEFYQEVTVSPDKEKNRLKKEIKIVWYYYSFYNKDVLLKYLRNIGKTRYVPNINTLYVVVLAIQAKIDNETLKGGISHELTHNFQSVNMEKPLFSSEKDFKVYNNSNKNINSNTQSFRILGTIVYLSYNFEQDAYLNSAYSYIIQECENGKEFLAVYSQTEAYNSLHKLRNNLDILKTALEIKKIGPLTRKHCKDEYNVSIEQLYNNGEKAYKRYAKKLARMCGQALNDLENKQLKEGALIHTRAFYKPLGLKLTEMEKLDETLNILGF